MPANASTKAKSNPTTAPQPEMPNAPRRKSTKRKKTKTAASVDSLSTTTSTGTDNSHPYLGDEERSVIETWNEKSRRARPSSATPDDPVVQAYIQAKMALFQTVMTVPKKRSVSSSLSAAQG